MSLHLAGFIRILHKLPGAFDHADLDPDTGTVVVANEAQGCLEVLDAQLLRHEVSMTFDERRQRLCVFLPKTGQAAVYEETDEGNASDEMDCVMDEGGAWG